MLAGSEPLGTRRLTTLPSSPIICKRQRHNFMTDLASWFAENSAAIIKAAGVAFATIVVGLARLWWKKRNTASLSEKSPELGQSINSSGAHSTNTINKDSFNQSVENHFHGNVTQHVNQTTDQFGSAEVRQRPRLTEILPTFI